MAASKRLGDASLAGRQETSLFYLFSLLAAAPILVAYLLGMATARAFWLLVPLLPVAYAAARWFSRPFREVTGVARRLIDGDLGARPSAPLPEDWQGLADALTTVARRLDDLTRRFDEQVGLRTAELNRKADQLRALGQVGRQVAAVLAPAQLLPYVVKLMRGTFAYDLVAVMQEEDGCLVLTAGAARGVPDFPRQRFSFGDPAIASIEAGIQGDGEISGEPARLIEAIEAKSQLVAPIRMGERALGALVVQSQRAGALDEDDLFTVQTIAGQVAVALENARLLDAERQLREFAVAEERNRLAREIHDTLAQAFMGILMHLRAMPGAADAETARAHREQAELLAQEGLQEARRSVWNLRPRSLEEKSFVSALSDELKRLQLRSGVSAILETPGDAAGLVERLSPRKQDGLLRIAQEALHNVAKHARAARVTVRLAATPAWVELTVKDDGVGFSPAKDTPAAGQEPAHAEKPSTGGGFGLAGMRERAHLLGGELWIDSVPGKGTTVTVRLPKG